MSFLFIAIFATFLFSLVLYFLHKRTIKKNKPIVLQKPVCAIGSLNVESTPVNIATHKHNDVRQPLRVQTKRTSNVETRSGYSDNQANLHSLSHLHYNNHSSYHSDSSSGGSSCSGSSSDSSSSDSGSGCSSSND